MTTGAAVEYLIVPTVASIDCWCSVLVREAMVVIVGVGACLWASATVFFLQGGGVAITPVLLLRLSSLLLNSATSASSQVGLSIRCNPSSANAGAFLVLFVRAKKCKASAVVPW